MLFTSTIVNGPDDPAWVTGTGTEEGHKLLSTTGAARRYVLGDVSSPLAIKTLDISARQPKPSNTSVDGHTQRRCRLRLAMPVAVGDTYTVISGTIEVSNSVAATAADLRNLRLALGQYLTKTDFDYFWQAGVVQ